MEKTFQATKLNTVEYRKFSKGKCFLLLINSTSRDQSKVRDNKFIRYNHQIDVTFIFKVVDTKFGGIKASATRTLGAVQPLPKNFLTLEFMDAIT